MSNIFKFKQFSVNQNNAPFKIGTDGVLLGSWVGQESTKIKNILDIGTGTGLIALMLAQRFPKSNINAIEINEVASTIAKLNFNSSPWTEQLEIENTSLQNYSPKNSFDLVVCNPPFFVNSEKSGNLAKDTARHTLELDFEAVLHFASINLNKTGQLSLVLPFDKKLEIEKLAIKSSLYISRICEVFPTPTKKARRILIELTKEKKITKNTSLIIEENGRHQYSAEYKKLTEDFYL